MVLYSYITYSNNLLIDYNYKNVPICHSNYLIRFNDNILYEDIYAIYWISLNIKNSNY